MDRIRNTIFTGIITGWVLYIFLVVLFQFRLESAISDVRVFGKIFENDPALSAAVKYSINDRLYEDSKIKNLQSGNQNDNTGVQFNIMTWRILQNLEVINSQTLPDEISPLINSSLGQIIKNSDLETLRNMTGLELLYEIQSKSGNSPSDDEHKEVALNYTKGIIASSPMVLRDYKNHVLICEEQNEECEEQNSWARKALAYIFPPEISGPLWSSGSLNELLELSYAHIGVSEQFMSIDGVDGKIDKIASYQQYNDLLLKILISIYNDDVVANRRDMVMVFKGVVQMFILITFCITMFVVGKLEFTTEKNDRFLDLLKTLLPTLGFIGTIYGLMKSLGEAYKIPIASGDANTSLAISEITSSLSIAFTTTLLAFILLIIVDIFRVYKLRNS